MDLQLVDGIDRFTTFLQREPIPYFDLFFLVNIFAYLISVLFLSASFCLRQEYTCAFCTSDLRAKISCLFDLIVSSRNLRLFSRFLTFIHPLHFSLFCHLFQLLLSPVCSSHLILRGLNMFKITRPCNIFAIQG